MNNNYLDSLFRSDEEVFLLGGFLPEFLVPQSLEVDGVQKYKAGVFAKVVRLDEVVNSVVGLLSAPSVDIVGSSYFLGEVDVFYFRQHLSGDGLLESGVHGVAILKVDFVGQVKGDVFYAV